MTLNARTIDNTIIDSIGRGVEYTSGGGCNALGIGGLSGFGEGNAPVSSSRVFPHLLTKLGL